MCDCSTRTTTDNQSICRPRSWSHRVLVKSSGRCVDGRAAISLVGRRHSPVGWFTGHWSKSGGRSANRYQCMSSHADAGSEWCVVRYNKPRIIANPASHPKSHIVWRKPGVISTVRLAGRRGWPETEGDQDCICIYNQDHEVCRGAMTQYGGQEKIANTRAGHLQWAMHM
jgi:hypothetical protein